MRGVHALERDEAGREKAGPKEFRHRLSVRGWYSLVLAVIGVLVVVVSVVSAGLLQRTAHVSDRLVDRISPARTEAYRMQAALLNQETGLRGYALTGDSEFLEPYTDGIAAERSSYERLRKLLKGEEELLADATAVRRAGQEWRRAYADPLVDRVEREGTQAADEDAVRTGDREFGLVREAFATQNADLARARAEGRAELDRTRAMRDMVLAGMLVAFLVVAVSMGVLLQYAVARPLRNLRRSTRAVADGAFEQRITPHGPADIQAVAADVEGMRTRLMSALEGSRHQQDVLARQAADLDSQTVELRRSNAELEQFAYVASHDLQEPLRKVASFCQLLEKRYGDQLDERAGQYIAFAVDGAKRMQVLINDLLTFSRVGRLHDGQEPVELGSVLDKALGNLAAAVEESGAVVERPGEMPRVVGDPTLLTMLWQNLVGNAVKFRSPERAPRVSVRVEEDGGEWRFSVTDNGIGIGAEFADKVFVIFQRLHQRDVYGGTGIGLALCKKIVEYHGGRIWLDTGYTDGARIVFTLPRTTTGLPAGDGGENRGDDPDSPDSPDNRDSRADGAPGSNSSSERTPA